MAKTSFISLFLTFLALKSESKHSQGTVSSKENWSFLDRFCFYSEVGIFKYIFSYPMKYKNQSIYLYYDSPTQWPAVYKSGKTCQQKEGVLKVENNQIMILNPMAEPTDCDYEVRNEETWIICDGSRRFSSYRERWWYIALANCNSSIGVYLDYDMNMTNGEAEDFWFYQFSADEFTILPVDVGFLLASLLMMVIAVAIAVILRARQMFHSTYKVFLTSLILEAFSLFFEVLANARYAQNGIGSGFAKLLGQMCRAASTSVFLLLLILMAKGLTVTRARLSSRSNWKITFFMTFFVLVYGALFIYQARVFDPGEVLYLYESFAGYGILVLRLAAWVWFCYAIYFTLVHYPEKRGFYYRFSTFFSLWFWMGPITIMLSNHVLAAWLREKVVNCVENVVAFLGFAAFMWITRPSAANNNFPYHVRTTQIEGMESDNTPFPHHVYELRAQMLDDIFTVSRNRTATQKQMSGKERPGSPEIPLTPLPPPSYEEIVTAQKIDAPLSV